MLPSLFREIDNLMNSVDSDFFKNYYYNVDGTFSKEEVDHFKVAIQLPGFKKEDLKITIEKDRLKIEGFSNQWSCERTYKKTFVLSEDIDSEKISSKLENGVLNLTLPKLEKAKKKVFEIKIE